eukprot:scaffold1762_cov39-Tisochrysis_lutea.AAC.3
MAMDHGLLATGSGRTSGERGKGTRRSAGMQGRCRLEACDVRVFVFNHSVSVSRTQGLFAKDCINEV